MSYVSVAGFGTDLVVSEADAPAARAQAAAIQEANDTAQKRYQTALTTYALAVKARKTVLDRNATNQTNYQNAMRSYASQVQLVDAANAAALASYNAILARWQTAKAAYDQAVSQRYGIVQGNMASASAVFRSGAPTPPDYATFQAQGYCYTTAQNAKWVQACAASKQVVRGVGALSLSGTAPECLWATLPVCKPFTMPPDPGAAPAKPVTQVVTAKPPAPPASLTVPPEPTPPAPPVLQDVPNVIVQGEKPKSFAVGGLLALVLLGGGVAYYFSTHKKKAA